MKKSEIPSILEKMQGKMMLGDYSLDTIKSYKSSTNNFLLYIFSHPETKNISHERRIESYLTWRVKEFDISPSTQGVEFNALIYFHRNILDVDVQGINAMRARPKNRIPPILSRENVSRLLCEISDQYKLMARIMYGTGIRITECLRLRIKDIDLANMKIVIHEGKGDSEGVVPLPSVLKDGIENQIHRSLAVWEKDKGNMIGVGLPRALEKKYKTLWLSKDWYWLFPNPDIARDPRTQRLQRHHVYDFSVQKEFVRARRKLKLPEYTTPHSLRHAFATHLAQDMLSKGFPQSMVEAEVQKYLRHVSRETLKYYVHLAAPKDAVISLPIESLP